MLMVWKKDILYAWQDDQHDHEACVVSATSMAQDICLKKGARLTPIRQRVLELVWGSHKPVGAYEILDEIKSEHKLSAPPTVYRALDFLMEHGFVHRIQSLNAYIGCSDPGHIYKGIILICNKCSRVLEVEDKSVSGSIKSFTSKLGFKLSTQSVEAAGLCPGCQA